MCNLSSSRSSFRMSTISFLLTVSKALDMSGSRSLISQSSDVIAFSASTLKLSTISLVLLPCLYAAWVGGVFFNILCKLLLSMRIARIFRSVDSIMIALKCSGGPAFLPDSLRGANVPFLFLPESSLSQPFRWVCLQFLCLFLFVHI